MNNTKQPKVIAPNPKQRPSPRPQPQNSPPAPQRVRKTSTNIQNVVSSVNSATSAVEAQLSKVNNFVGRPQPQDINQISEKHDYYITLILE